MTRIVEKSERTPLRLLKNEITGNEVWLCRCGLSANGAFCDGSHRAIGDEPQDEIVRYRRETAGMRAERVTVSGEDAQA